MHQFGVLYELAGIFFVEPNQFKTLAGDARKQFGSLVEPLVEQNALDYTCLHLFACERDFSRFLDNALYISSRKARNNLHLYFLPADN